MSQRMIQKRYIINIHCTHIYIHLYTQWTSYNLTHGDITRYFEQTGTARGVEQRLEWPGAVGPIGFW